MSRLLPYWWMNPSTILCNLFGSADLVLKRLNLNIGLYMYVVSLTSLLQSVENPVTWMLLAIWIPIPRGLWGILAVWIPITRGLWGLLAAWIPISWGLWGLLAALIPIPQGLWGLLAVLIPIPQGVWGLLAIWWHPRQCDVLVKQGVTTNMPTSTENNSQKKEMSRYGNNVQGCTWFCALT